MKITSSGFTPLNHGVEVAPEAPRDKGQSPEIATSNPWEAEASRANALSRATGASLLSGLEQAFGTKVARAVLAALDIDPRNPRLLTVGELETATSAANHARSAFQGLNFSSKLIFSASNCSAAFEECARELGLDPAKLTSPLAQTIDDEFSAALRLASGNDRYPVDLKAARELMLNAIETAIAGGSEIN